MSTRALRVVISSMELARVEEITPKTRRFRVGNDGQPKDSVVSFDPETDALFCHAHGTYDDCTCTARVRLCGVLTYTVTPDVLTRDLKLETK